MLNKLEFLDDLPDEVKGLEILNSANGYGSSDPKLPATLTNQVHMDDYRFVASSLSLLDWHLD